MNVCHIIRGIDKERECFNLMNDSLLLDITDDPFCHSIKVQNYPRLQLLDNYG